MRDVFFKISIAVFICCIIVLGTYKYNEYADAKKRQELIEENSIIVQTSVATSSDAEVSTNNASVIEVGNQDFAIEYIDEDMQIKEVKTYKNVIEIPQFDIVAVVNEGVDKASLSSGVGHYPSTPWIGEKGNCTIAGHFSATYNCIFNGIDKMKLLDTWYAYDSEGNKHEYVCIGISIVQPDEIGIVGAGDPNEYRMTLTTCSDGGTRRRIIKGIEFQSEEEKEYYVSNIEKYQVARALEVNNTINYYHDLKSLIKFPSSLTYSGVQLDKQGNSKTIVDSLKPYAYNSIILN